MQTNRTRPVYMDQDRDNRFAEMIKAWNTYLLSCEKLMREDKPHEIDRGELIKNIQTSLFLREGSFKFEGRNYSTTETYKTRANNFLNNVKDFLDISDDEINISYDYLKIDALMRKLAVKTITLRPQKKAEADKKVKSETQTKVALSVKLDMSTFLAILEKHDTQQSEEYIFKHYLSGNNPSIHENALFLDELTKNDLHQELSSKQVLLQKLTKIYAGDKQKAEKMCLKALKVKEKILVQLENIHAHAWFRFYCYQSKLQKDKSELKNELKLEEKKKADLMDQESKTTGIEKQKKLMLRLADTEDKILTINEKITKIKAKFDQVRGYLAKLERPTKTRSSIAVYIGCFHRSDHYARKHELVKKLKEERNPIANNAVKYLTVISCLLVVGLLPTGIGMLVSKIRSGTFFYWNASNGRELVHDVEAKYKKIGMDFRVVKRGFQ